MQWNRAASRAALTTMTHMNISDMADLLQETPEDLELNENVSAPATTLACEEPGTIGGTRVSYGIADILFPMTPPKPKGARLVRGPLRFN